MQKIFSCSCYGALLARGQLLNLAHSTIYGFTDVSRIEGLLEKTGKTSFTSLCNGAKGLTFGKSNDLMISIFRWVHGIWPTIDYLAAVGKFALRLLPSWVQGGGITDH